MKFEIETLTAFVAIDPESGDEGLIGLPLPGFNHAITMPAVAGDEQRAKDLYPHVKRYCDAINVRFRVIKLHTRLDVTEQYKKLEDG